MPGLLDFRISLALLLGGFVFLANASALTPQRLRCEYLENPLGLDELRPRLSWIVSSPDRGARQTAFQIIAASTESNLAAERGDLWDTGRVESENTTPIAFGGRALHSAERVWWKVRVWDAAGVASDWSAAARWEMGLLEAGDWNGQWIGGRAFRSASPAKPQPLPLLRRAFKIDGVVARARAYVCGVGFFELYINGRRIGDHLLDPAFTRYDRRLLYVTHDITAALRSGENAVGVMLGNGWFNVESKAAWDFDQAPWRATPRALVQLSVELEDGRTITLSSDGDWKTCDGPITVSNIYGGENYDSRREQSGWDQPGFDDRAWQGAVVVDAPKGRLVAQAMHAVRLDRSLKPVAVTEPAPGVFLFDAGQNLTGNAELALSGPSGTEVVLRYGEKLDAAGRLDQAEIGVHVLRYGADQAFQTDRYTLKGEGVERWHARFGYNGFRYVEVAGAPGTLTKDNLTIRYFHSAAPEVGEFECSNPLLNRIWQNGLWSYFSNLFGFPTDCPQREKNGWTGDAQIACEQGLFYADGITIYHKWINDLADEQFITGALPGIVPTNGQWGYAFGSGPAWDSAFLLVPWHLYEYYGDATLLKRNYEGYRRYVDYLTSRAKDGIVKIGLGDWCPWKTKTPEDITDTSYYYRDARIVASVARMLGKDADAKRYDLLADGIRAAFTQKFYDTGTGTYGIGSQTSLGCALYQGLVEPKNEAKTVDRLVAEIARNDDHIDFGYLGAKFVLNTLTAHGRADVAYTMVSQKTQPGWGWQVGQGATTLWECWTPVQSNNHTFFGDVNAWMMKTLAGINPDPAAPGFKHILIKPNIVGDLVSARGSYDSIHGKIVSAWNVDQGELRLSITIPANCNATVFLPTADPATVREGDRALPDAPGVTLRERQAGCVILDVGSGDYAFTSTLR